MLFKHKKRIRSHSHTRQPKIHVPCLLAEGESRCLEIRRRYIAVPSTLELVFKNYILFLVEIFLPYYFIIVTQFVQNPLQFCPSSPFPILHPPLNINCHTRRRQYRRCFPKCLISIRSPSVARQIVSIMFCNHWAVAELELFLSSKTSPRIACRRCKKLRYVEIKTLPTGKGR